MIVRLLCFCISDALTSTTEAFKTNTYTFTGSVLILMLMLTCKNVVEIATLSKGEFTMKTKETILVTTIILFALSQIILLPQTFADEHTTLSLPEGAVARLGKGWINEIEYSAAGDIIAVASTVGIWLYDAETGDEQALLTGHTEPVRSISFNSDDTELVSGSDDNTVRLWDVVTRTLKATYIGHTGAVKSVDFSPDDTMVASGSADNTVGLWDVDTGTRIATLRHSYDVNSVQFRPDGETLASAGDDELVRLWDIGTLTQKATLNVRHYVYSISFSPDGNTIATGAENRLGTLWDVGTGALLASLEPENGEREVHHVSFSKDGKTLACSSPGGTLRLWDVDTRTENTTLINKGESIYNRSVDFNKDSQTLATASWGEVRLWDVATGKEKSTLTTHNDAVQYIDFSPDGSLLANSDPNGTVHLWDVATRTRKSTLLHGDDLWEVQFSPDGSTLSSQTWGGTVRLWDVTTEAEMISISDVYGASFSPDGKKFATGHHSNVQLWDLTTMTRIITLPSPSYNVNLSFNSDGSMLASGSYDNSVRLWDLTTLERKAEFWHTYDVNSVDFSPDDSTLASGSDDGTVRFWDLMTLRETARLSHNNEVLNVHFSKEGNTLISVDGYRGWGKALHLWDVSDVQTATYKAGLIHDNNLNSYTFSPDNSTIATASDDSFVRLWDVATGTLKATLRGHTADVSSVHFSPDGSILASGSSDGSVLFWDFASVRTVTIAPNVVESAAIGEQLTFQVRINKGSNIGGYQATVEFDPTALQYVESANGDYLPEGAFFLDPIVSENSVQVAGTSLTGISQKTEGSLVRLTFEVLAIKESILQLSNVIVTDINGEHLQHFTVSGRVVKPQPKASSAIVHVTPVLVNSPEVGETIIFNADITGGENIASYELIWHYDSSALEFLASEKGGYIPTSGRSKGIGNGDGTLESASFRVKTIKSSAISVTGFFTAPNGLISIPTFESAQINAFVFGDVNRDGEVNIQDLVLVAANFGKPVPDEGHPADVNGDGQIDIVDLVKVAGALSNGTSAPALLAQVQDIELTKKDVEEWLSRAQQQKLTDPISLQGIIFLEQLLSALTPKETALLPNYPNPFNPETWIPYQLAQPADVTVTIYAADGTLVRTLDLGHQPVGLYQSRNRAAHWDGKNAVGESVASGVYFYTLKAGDFSATRKMLIRK